MILSAHNAHVTSIQSPSVPADPGIGIVGSPQVDKWSGDAQVYVDEDTVDRVVQGQRSTVYEVIINVPANLPVLPVGEDLLQVRYFDGTTEQFIVRMIDRGTSLLGFFRIHCRRS